MSKVDYDNIAKDFSKSRKNMKWEEIDYFISSYLGDFENKNFLDVWCGSGRLLEQFSNSFDIAKINYLGVDLSIGMIDEAKKIYKNNKIFKPLRLIWLNINKVSYNWSQTAKLLWPANSNKNKYKTNWLC